MVLIKTQLLLNMSFTSVINLLVIKEMIDFNNQETMRWSLVKYILAENYQKNIF